MKACIVGSGFISKYDRLLEYAGISDLFICCDGGMKHFFQCDIVPNIIIGDFDSAEEEHIKYFRKLGVPFRRFPTEKDFTDMEIGLSYAIEKGADEIFIFGGTGSRLDHFLANACILKKALDRQVSAWLIDENNKISIIDRHIKISGRKGDLVSLLPFSEEVSGIYTKGLYYSLSNGCISKGSSIGVSNFMTEAECEISVEQGVLFIILSKD